MANVPISNLTTTWNNGATTFTGVKLNVTDTASASASLLMDLQVGGTSKFKVNKDGGVTAPGGISFGTTGVLQSSNGLVLDAGPGQLPVYLSASSGDLRLKSSYSFGWSSGNAFNTTLDVVIARDAADTLAQRRTTNAQTFRVYNTYTDASNYERAKIAWDTNVLKIGTEKAGTGTARALELQTDGTTRLTLNATNGQIVGAVFIATAYLVTPASALGGNGGVYFGTAGSNGSQVQSTGVGVIAVGNYAGNDFSRLQFGGTTSSFPALKRSSTTLQARLADDSDYGSLQGKLTTETAYAAGDPTTTGYLVLYDSTGTAYKVPAVAV